MRASGTAARPETGGHQTLTSHDVAGHTRLRRTGSIGFRLMLPVVAASLGLLAGGAVLVMTSVNAAGDAHRARVLVDGAAAALRLVDEIEQEVAETNAARESGAGAAAPSLTAQRTRTDEAMAEYLAASQAALAEAPGIAGPVGHVTALLEPFARARAGAFGPGVALSGFGDAFEQITHHLLDLTGAIAEQLTDQRLGNLARSAAVVSEIKHLTAEHRDLLRAAFARGELTRADLVTLAALDGDRLAKLSEFAHTATAETRRLFTRVYTGPDVQTADALRNAVLRDGDAAALSVDPEIWYSAQNNVVGMLRTIERELSGTLAREAHRHQVTAQRQAAVTGGLAVILIAGTLAGGASLAVRTTRRLRRLRQLALSVARGELPTAVAQVAQAKDPEAVRDAMGASHRRVSAMLDAGRDEVAEVAAAFGVVHQQALRLAAEQALLRLDASAVFVALSRRGQSLVHRQLQLIDEFERTEHRESARARLAALDNLATRMRRNEENLLVLAGGEPGRRYAQPVVLTDVVRTAAAEIEAYARVDAPAAEDVWVAAHAVRDIVHLLAELLDNATAFSPPHTRVRVLVQDDGDAATLSIIDAGIGMSDEQIAEANRRLTQPIRLTSDLVGTMGLLVVARLAARHGVRVRLGRAPMGGTIAEVRLPGELLVANPPGIVPRLRLGPTAPVRAIAPPLSVPPALPVGPTPTQPALPVGPTPSAQPALPRSPEPAAPAGVDRPLPAAVTSAMVMTGTRTAAGLPLRRPGTHAVTTPPAGHDRHDRFLDPDTVRARLASLASGMAAARRDEAPPSAPYLE